MPFLVGDMHRLNNRNPFALVREYIENEGLRLVDFFRKMDRDQGGSISRSEFVEGLTVSSDKPLSANITSSHFGNVSQKANVNMTQAQIDRLMDMLDQDGDGEIDYKFARDVTLLINTVSHD